MASGLQQLLLVIGAVLASSKGYQQSIYPFYGSPIITAYTVPVFGDASAVESVFTIASRLQGHQGFVPQPSATIFVPPAYPLIAGSPLPTPSYAIPLTYQQPGYNPPPLTPSAVYKLPIVGSSGDTDTSGTANGDSFIAATTTTPKPSDIPETSSSGSSSLDVSLTGDSNAGGDTTGGLPISDVNEAGSSVPETSLGGESVDSVTIESQNPDANAEENSAGSSSTEVAAGGSSSCQGSELSSEKCGSSSNGFVSGTNNGPQATTTFTGNGGYTLNISNGFPSEPISDVSANNKYPPSLSSDNEVSQEGNENKPGFVEVPFSNSISAIDITNLTPGSGLTQGIDTNGNSDFGFQAALSGSEIVPSGSSESGGSDNGGLPVSSEVSLESGFVPIATPTNSEQPSSSSGSDSIDLYPPLQPVHPARSYGPPRTLLDSYGVPVTENYWAQVPIPVRATLTNLPTRYPQAPGNNVYYRLQRSLHKRR